MLDGTVEMPGPIDKLWESPPETKKVQLNLRVAETLKERLKRLQKGLATMAELRQENAEAVDLTWTAIRALTIGLEMYERQLLGDHGVFPPVEDEKAWAKVRAAMAAGLSDSPKR